MFNAENGVLSVKPLMLGGEQDGEPELLDSRIELINDDVMATDELEAALFGCRLTIED
jgi:hypothetical protein